MIKTTAIYRIKNLVSDQFYIGSSLHYERRKTAHINCLRKNKHDNVYLQRAWNKYGEKNCESPESVAKLLSHFNLEAQ
jgi:hypothetical protein